MLIGQVGKDRKINTVFGKTLGVLGHAELLEPVGNLLHRRPLSVLDQQDKKSTTRVNSL
jgi:hypothetical protein